MIPYAPSAARPYVGPPQRSWAPPAPKLGSPDLLKELKARIPEFKEAGNFFLVTGAFLAGDFALHEVFETTRGAKTPPFYFSNKLLWTIPGLLVGRLISDYIVKGSQFVRALTIATTAVGVLQIHYFKSYPPEFNLAVFLMHEALLVPLSLLITGPSPVTGFYGSEK